jgi:hypothetical protein
VFIALFNGRTDVANSSSYSKRKIILENALCYGFHSSNSHDYANVCQCFPWLLTNDQPHDSMVRNCSNAFLLLSFLHGTAIY